LVANALTGSMGAAHVLHALAAGMTQDSIDRLRLDDLASSQSLENLVRQYSFLIALRIH
jgi:hypothetical protein